MRSRPVRPETDGRAMGGSRRWLAGYRWDRWDRWVCGMFGIRRVHRGRWIAREQIAAAPVQQLAHRVRLNVKIDALAAALALKHPSLRKGTDMVRHRRAAHVQQCS